MDTKAIFFLRASLYVCLEPLLSLLTFEPMSHVPETFKFIYPGVYSNQEVSVKYIVVLGKKRVLQILYSEFFSVLEKPIQCETLSVRRGCGSQVLPAAVTFCWQSTVQQIRRFSSSYH